MRSLIAIDDIRDASKHYYAFHSLSHVVINLKEIFYSQLKQERDVVNASIGAASGRQTNSVDPLSDTKTFSLFAE